MTTPLVFTFPETAQRVRSVMIDGEPWFLAKDVTDILGLAKIEEEKALPASEQIANMLHAVRTTADAQLLMNRFRAEALRAVADEVDATAAEMERVLGRRLETSSVERGVANRIRRMADKLDGGAR